MFCLGTEKLDTEMEAVLNILNYIRHFSFFWGCSFFILSVEKINKT
jgi:hypothetical protein